MKLWQDFNDYIGTKIAIFLSSMGCFWIIIVLTVGPLLKDHPHDIIGWIQYVVQTVFQGAALPLLGYVSDRGAKAVMELIKEMHDIMLGKFNEKIDDIDCKVTQELKEIKKLANDLHEELVQHGKFETHKQVETKTDNKKS